MQQWIFMAISDGMYKTLTQKMQSEWIQASWVMCEKEKGLGILAAWLGEIGEPR